MQITKHVHAIKIPFKIETETGILDRFVYSYIINGETPILIDSGVSNSQIIFDYMEIIGLNPEDVSLLILSHSHPDHIGLAQSIVKNCSCEVAAHSREKSWIENTELQYKERPVPGFDSLVEGPVNVDIVLEDEDEFELGEKLNLKVIHTPGHSNGSISLYLREEGVLFTGDAVPLKGDLPIYEDYKESIESLKKLKDVGNLNWVLSSWDEPRSDCNMQQIFDDAIEYLETINETVLHLAESEEDVESLDFTKKVLKELGIPEMAANPIVQRSFLANLDK